MLCYCCVATKEEKNSINILGREKKDSRGQQFFLMTDVRLSFLCISANAERQCSGDSSCHSEDRQHPFLHTFRTAFAVFVADRVGNLATTQTIMTSHVPVKYDCSVAQRQM